MRVAVSVSIFLLAVTTIGCSEYQRIRASLEFSGNPAEWPNFDLEEATAMIGKHVRVIYTSGQHRVSKVSENRDPSLGYTYSFVKIGERGKVIGIHEFEDLPSSYFLVVRWDELGDEGPMISGFPKKAYGVFLRDEDSM